MSGSAQFEVETDVLRAAAGQLGNRADDADTIAGKARDADVEDKSWGLLGLSLGLYAGYSSARTSADDSIGKVKAFLASAEGALNDTARDYDEADASGGQIFGDIQTGMSS